MGRHDVDPVSLLAGLCATAGAVLYLLHDAGRVSIQGRTAAVLVAVAAVAVGVAWLISGRSQPRG